MQKFMFVVLAGALAVSGCGRTDLGRSPSQIVIDSFQAASGAKPGDFSNTLDSDVLTMVKKTVGGQQIEVPTIFNDLGRVKFHIQLRDAGTTASPTTPTGTNSVTFTRYRVSYQRADGRNQQGVDVPYGFDSALTLTVPAGGDATASFELVRHTAKEEAPLQALINNSTIISTIATVTFYGQDLAGNDVVATGTIGVFFGNFGDPQ